ncbi:MAG TPA: FAD-linked oxidase C-terminal domain-containing protein, partial [Anaerolineales bacterium]|nr:FAD-linked oxidase C-terminal domain-containing protein [Anaerolineales bacterium]
SGEHGDGLARSEWLGELLGEELLGALRLLKTAADPHNLLNPGKIVSPDSAPAPRMDTSLRLGNEYQAAAWQPVFGYSQQVNIQEAIEQCNGAAVCRKDSGVMCPSFQATEEEEHSTRGRANLLRAMISGQFPTQELAEKAVYEALDLCLACKGCKAECPSSVDMAKLRYEFLAYYYSSQSETHARRRLRDYLFAYIGDLARIGWRFAPLVNAILRAELFKSFAESRLGLSRQHPLPVFHSPAYRMDGLPLPPRDQPVEKVLLLSDAFNEYFRPQVGIGAVRLLQAAGCEVVRLPLLGAGRTLISKGFLKPAQAHARKLAAAIERADPAGTIPIVGLEPSEVYTLLDEYPDLLNGNPEVKYIAERSWLIDEYLLRNSGDSVARFDRIPPATGKQFSVGERILLHGHCYQKARPPAADGYPTGVEATRELLERCGYQVELIDSGCCGMAGAFGYEKEHYAISHQVAELKLLPAIRKQLEDHSGRVRVCAAGVSCDAQIEDSLNISTYHPASLVGRALGIGGFEEQVVKS